MPTHAMILRAGDKVENTEGRIGLVVSVRRDPDCDCLAIAWDDHNVMIYSRSEFLNVDLVSRLPEGKPLDYLPSAALGSLYMVPDPSSWLVMAIVGWHRHRRQLERISEHGLSSPDDSQLAAAACAHIRSVLDRMRGVHIDFSHN